MQKFNVLGFMKNLDMFEKPIPTFNIGGKTSVKTVMGSCCSVFIMMMTFAYGLLKLEHLIAHKNPFITSNIEPH